MINRVWNQLDRPWLLATVAAILVSFAGLLAGGCDTYYIPPPPVTVTLTSPTFGNANLVISALNSAGQVQASTLPLTGTVSNSTNATVVYSVGQNGTYVQGGNAQWGYIAADGVYTAPLVVPTPNEVVVQAAAQADSTITATVTITLLNPAAQVTNVTPNLVTVGVPANFDITGTEFYPGSTVNVSGATVSSTQMVSATEIKVSALIQQPGVVGVSVNNPYPISAPNSFLVRSMPTSPATSSAIAVTAAATGSGGSTALATEAYVPRGASLAVVNLDTNQQVGIVNMPTGYTASMAAADPAENEVIVAGTDSNLLQVVSTTTNSVTNSLTVPVSTSASVDGLSCKVCALMVDSARHTAIVNTAAGLFTLDLDTGSASSALAADLSLNLAYDPGTQRVFIPYSGSSGSGIQIVDLEHSTFRTAEPTGAQFSTNTASATWDAGSGVLTAGDSGSSVYLNLNFNDAQIANSVSQVAAGQFTVTAGCAQPWVGMDIDMVGHLGWLANGGGCVAVAALPPAAVNGTPAPPTSVEWARAPASPDGIPWQSTAADEVPTLSAYTGSDGRAYGIALRQDGAMLLKVDLALLQQAPAVSGGTDANQVDATQAQQNGTTVSALTYIALH
ncbi:MAG: hypothetical protein ACRD1Y_02960 [Terriglobales bacterium]